MPSPARRLTRRFFRRDPIRLATDLLGRHLVRRYGGHELIGKIVEVEAYLGIEDRAAHSYGGRRTERNRSMWEDGGTAYVYFVYGMHWCFNVVSETAGQPSACLIRAVEPLEGLDQIHRLRRRKKPSLRLSDSDLCSGPAKLAQAFDIDKRHDGLDLTKSEELFLTHGSPVPEETVTVSPRIGVDYAQEWAEKPLRFALKGSIHVSRALTRRRKK